MNNDGQAITAMDEERIAENDPLKYHEEME